MLTKIQRFLYSIGLEEIERFDLSFVLTARNPYKPAQIDMVMEKSMPWQYALLDEFIQALSTIQYPYSLRFSYINEPSEEDVASLFYEWYFCRYAAIPGFGLEKVGEKRLAVPYPSQESKTQNERAIKEFRDLLQFINYPFIIEERVVESAPKQEPAPVPIKEETVEPTLKEASFDLEPEPVAAPREEPVAKEMAPEEEPQEAPVNKPEPVQPEPTEEKVDYSAMNGLSDEALNFDDIPEIEEISAQNPTEIANEEPAEEPVSAQESAAEPIQEEPVLSAQEDSCVEEEPVDEDDDDDDEPDEEPEKDDLSDDEPDDGRSMIETDAAYYREESSKEMLRQYEEMQVWKKEQADRERVWTKGNYTQLKNIDEIFKVPLGNVDFEGEVFQAKFNLGRNGRVSNTFAMGDSTNAVTLKVFEGRLHRDEIEKIQPGQRMRIRGAIDTDKFTHQRIVIVHFMNKLPTKTYRQDNEPEKRVELHLHTNMSTMDGVQNFQEFYDAAKEMGMKAIGLCDHGAVQSFPAAQVAHDKHAKALKEAGSTDKALKILYGCEMYMIEDRLHPIMNPAPIPLRNARYCVFDTETTGLSSRHDKIIEFGGVIIENGRIIKSYGTLINPQCDLKEAEGALRVNKIDPKDLLTSPTLEQVLPNILEMFKDAILVAHNADFDVGILNTAFEELGQPRISNPVIDTVALSRYLFPSAGNHREGALLRRLGLNEAYDDEEAHRAVYDATALSEGWQEISYRLEQTHPGITHADLADLVIPNPNKMTKPEAGSPEEVLYAKVAEDYRQLCRHLHDHHITVYAKNKEGIHDLFYLVSESLTTYMARVPKIPKEVLEQYRKNLLFGSACFNGEIFDVAMTRNRDELVKAVSFYDFIEIQPLENYSYLLNMGRLSSKERLVTYLRDIVEAARIAGKPVVATGDAHYVEPSDKIYRDVFIATKGIGAGSHPLFPPARERMPYFDNPDQHFRSTREMLDSFRQWTTDAEAHEFVVTNSNLIADMIDDNIVIVDDKTYTPNANLPHSEDIIRNLCESNFHKNYDYLYGDDDPSVLSAIDFAWKRLQRELSGIIGSGYAVTYYIAHRLIQLANAEPEHFIVGSRGSVGSSFAATMAEITEVNALPAHYHCPHCHFLEFQDTSKYRSGNDLPDRMCPKCGHKLDADGQNIPFETFLGFNADKVPDIDLNFEDESQHRAHDYCRQLLGATNVFRAGTIETVAEKTAFGYVRGYFEKIGRDLSAISSQYIAYIASHCQGVKRTTGQHPGGIVVIPADMSVYDFTAVQHPADDINSDWMTTHFDFHALHDEVLKLDILGHVDPMAMRYYRDLTGVPIESIPLNDPKVLSLFSSNKELKMHRNYLNYDTGAAALPEFGTTQGMQMLSTIRPKTFNDLIIISGLAHGTNVWAGNAEDLIKAGKSINEIIGCRDEIMTYLISMGLDSSIAFKIMEGVRKGKKLTSQQEAEMRAHGVPEFYIDSCNKIAYLFPRGHAVAYVTMAVRVAYFKLYYPLEFYAVFFSIRSDDWDIKTMIEGEESVIARIKEWTPRLHDRENPLSTKETKQYKTLLIALEMLERGYKFANIDLYRSDYKMFVVDHENKALIPPFSVIEGLGQSVAKSICDAREEKNEYGEPKRFISKEDLLQRASRLSSSLLKKLDELGVLKDLSETNQVSLFEFI